MNNKESTADLQNIRRTSPFRIAFIYALFGALWILLSDKLLALAVRDPATMTRISVYKGWAFIALTAWMLYLLIRKDSRKLYYAAALIKGNEELMLNVLETLPIGVWVVGREGKIRYGNRAGQAIWCGAEFVGIDQYDRYKGWRVDRGKV